MKYEIISSGSKGNCVVINDVMVDCGVPFKKLKEHLYDVKYLLLTHIHSDHINPTALKSIKKLFPRIEILGNYEVHQKFGVDIVVNADYETVTDDYTFLPFECVHDVLTYGFTWEYNGLNILYATDTANMEHAPSGEYDYVFLESNHDEKKLELAGMKTTYGYNPYLSGKRHLSTQQAKSFYYMNRRNKDSEFIELHKSSRFY